MVEPQSTALAKLCAYCIFASLDYSVYSSNSTTKKRTRPEENEVNIALFQLLIICYSRIYTYVEFTNYN